MARASCSLQTALTDKTLAGQIGRRTAAGPVTAPTCGRAPGDGAVRRRRVSRHHQPTDRQEAAAKGRWLDALASFSAIPFGKRSKNRKAAPKSMCTLGCMLLLDGTIIYPSFQHIMRMSWRRGWDSNPRYACTHNGFRDRPDRPLWHLSVARAYRDARLGPRNRRGCDPKGTSSKPLSPDAGANPDSIMWLPSAPSRRPPDLR